MNFNQEDLMILNELDDIVLIENIKDIIKVKKKQLDMQKNYQRVYDFLRTISENEICNLNLLKEDKLIVYSLPMKSCKIVIDFSESKIQFKYDNYLYKTDKTDELIDNLPTLHDAIARGLLDYKEIDVNIVPRRCGTVKKIGDDKFFM